MDEVRFDIDTQAAAAITNIGGDATIEGGIHASAKWETLELRRTIVRAQQAVADLGLSPLARATVNHSLDEAAREAAKPKPDRYRVAEHLGAAARTLKEAGALVGAGNAVLQALRRAAELLGPAGLAAIGAL
jgi:hypothetical protein